jgi:SAM-dependent methyltransferase
MDARCLDFPDAYFTHSINNFYIQAVPEPHKAMAEIYRTLKPGGTAVVTSWAPVPHVAAIKRANAKTRGEDSPLLMSFKPENYTTAFLIDVIQTAGFEIFESDISEYDCIRRLGGRELGLEEWCAALWGASGQPEGGWTQSDEAKWDEAIAEMVQCFQEHEDVSEHAGCWEVAMRAHIAIVKKGD